MPHQFRKHYTRDEARALLPHVRQWLTRLQHLRQRAAQLEPRVAALRRGGEDIGGPTVNEHLRLLVEMQQTLAEFCRRDIQIKDLDRGLVDFPAIVAGREVFLCWEQGEADIDYWHDLDAGYAGREPL
jgi:hypothetical protein